MSHIPQHVSAEISALLNRIKRHFKAPVATLLVRNPTIEETPGSMDLLMTDDDLEAVLVALQRLAEMDHARTRCEHCGQFTRIRP